MLASFPPGQRLPLQSASFVCVNKVERCPHWALAQARATDTSKSVSTTLKQQINLLILLRLEFTTTTMAGWLYLSVSLSLTDWWLYYTTSLWEAVKSNQHQSTCLLQWPCWHEFFWNLISQRKCIDLTQPPAFCHIVARSVVRPSESRETVSCFLVMGLHV